MLNLLGWLIVGGLIGWLGSLGLSSNRGRQSNIVAAMIGAVLGGLWFSWPDLGAVTSSDLMSSLNGLFIACLGAVSLLTITNVVQHGRELALAGRDTYRAGEDPGRAPGLDLPSDLGATDRALALPEHAPGAALGDRPPVPRL